DRTDLGHRAPPGPGDVLANRLGGLGVEVVDLDPGTGPGRRHGVGLAQPATAAGDAGALAGQLDYPRSVLLPFGIGTTWRPRSGRPRRRMSAQPSARTATAPPASPAAQPVNTPTPPPRAGGASLSSAIARAPVGPCGW